MTCRGMRLRRAMAERGFRKQYALAVSLHVNESTVTRWLSGGPMSLESAIDLCRILDVSLDWLLLGQGSMTSHHSPGATDALEAANRSKLARLHDGLTPTSREFLALFLQSLAD